MKKSVFNMLVVVGVLLVCTAAQVQAFEIVTREMLQEETVTQTDLIPTVDNFIVLFDTSGSTNEMVPGKDISKIVAAKTLLKERNAWLPDLGYNAGLYVYTNNETLMGSFKEIAGMQPYDRDTFAAAIDQLPEKGQGPTMLQAGLHGLRKVLDGLTGKTAVIIFTDGTFTVNRGAKKPLQIAQDLAKNNDVCFYLISSADASAEKALLENVAKINACSRVVPLARFLDNPQYLSGALFTVKTSSYARLVPVTKVVGFVADDILFDYDSSTLRSDYHAELEKLGEFLQNNPDAYVVAAGFADNKGGEEYNLGLSKRRVDSVASYLVGQAGIDESRIVRLWFGELNPVDDNSTESGRQQNRRVELAVGGI